METAPKIEMHPARVFRCEECGEWVYAHLVEGEPHTMLCSCGLIYTPQQVWDGNLAYFFDCDECGCEVTLVPNVIQRLNCEPDIQIPDVLRCPCGAEFELEQIV